METVCRKGALKSSPRPFFNFAGCTKTDNVRKKFF